MNFRRAPFVAMIGVGTVGVLSTFRRVEVHGDSMLPRYAPGDRLLVLRRGRQLREGDVVVLRDPRNRKNHLIKRIHSTAVDGSIYVLGDNPQHSTDSRTFGLVSPSDIVGRVIRRY